MTRFNWRDYLSLANWLDERPVEDAKLTVDDAAPRTVIGRAYYAAFHVARLFVDTKVREGVLRWPATRRSIHDKVWEALQTHPDRAVVDLGIKGVILKRNRTEADYSSTPNEGRSTVANQSRQLARDIISGLDASPRSKP